MNIHDLLKPDSIPPLQFIRHVGPWLPDLGGVQLPAEEPALSEGAGEHPQAAVLTVLRARQRQPRLQT